MDNTLHARSLVDLRLKHMATNLKSTDQRIPFDGNPSPFPPFGNIGAPYMGTLSLPGFTIGLPVWLFSTSLVQNVMISLQSSTPPTGQNQPPVNPKVDPFPSSSVVSSSLTPLCLVKVVILVTKRLRRRRKGRRRRRRRRKFSKEATKQPLL